MPRYFTLEEAEALLPLLNQILIEMQARKRRLDEVQARLREVAVRAAGNGHVQQDEARDPRQEIEQLSEALNTGIRRLNDLGVELKGIDQGLLDFRALRQGREVYLCWQVGEEHIEFWHELDTGFAGRRPLSELE
jgi:hypothetical protein